MKKRILVLLAVVALMVMMLAISVAPALGSNCSTGQATANDNIGTGSSGNDKAPYRDKGPGQNFGMDTSESHTTGEHCR